MRSHFYRICIVTIIVGFALIGRGVGMGNATFLWLGVSLVAANVVLLLSFFYRSVSSDAQRKPTSPDTAN